MPLPMSNPIRVAFIAAECEPWAKTGGLADVVDALARALGQVGGDALDGLVDVYLPNYRGVPVPEGARAVPLTVPDPHAAGGVTELRLLIAETHGYRLHLIDHPPAFDRDGPYGTPAGDHPDNAWRFGLLCRAALEHLRTADRPPDVIHIHDWHTVPALMQRDGPLSDDPALAGAAFLLTIHNLAYHGWTPAAQVVELGLELVGGSVPASPAGLPAASPAASTTAGGDGIDLLRTGIQRAELVNTVSPGFAVEALTPEMGMGLDTDLAARGDRFFGILNGLDTDLWDPATDAALPASYSRADRSGKARCRAALLEEIGLDPADPRPVLSMIGRLDQQKGFDLVAEAAPALLAAGFRLAVLGSGNHDVVEPLRKVAAGAAGRRGIALVERFDRDLARRMYAGADGFLMPSRFEPCGTGQMVALRYGTPPIVHATGGLRDTVVDVDADPAAGTGFAFETPTAKALVDACRRFKARFDARGPAWEALLDRGMAVDFDWRTASAPAYLAAYERAIELRRWSARDAEIGAARVGPVVPHNATIELAEYDPAWPGLFEREAARVRRALGDRALLLEHVGSTSVPGLAAKPLIDIVLAVADSGDEPGYVPALEAAGYVLRIREPQWYEHRLLKGPDADVNLHVFSRGCPEIERMLRFRDHLRSHAADRALYEGTKRELAVRQWRHVQDYADAKTAVVNEILDRAGR